MHSVIIIGLGSVGQTMVVGEYKWLHTVFSLSHWIGLLVRLIIWRGEFGRIFAHLIESLNECMKQIQTG